MFAWLRRKQINEQKKLLFQNHAAASGGMAAYFQQIGDTATLDLLAAIQKENRRVALTFDGSAAVSPEDLRLLVKMNDELRLLFHEAETKGGEGRLRALMGQPAKRPDFDARYKPLLGWKRYYKDN